MKCPNCNHEIIDEKINIKGLDKGSLKDDLIAIGALKKGAPVYDADVDKVVKYALKNSSNERRVILAKNFAVIRGSKQSDDEKAFWKAFSKKWEEEKDKK